MSQEQRHVQYVIEAPGVGKAELFTRANVWVAKTFRDAKSVIQVNDKDAGRLVGKGNAVCNELRQFGDVMNDYYLAFIMDITTKDGKVRAVFENLSMLTKDGSNSFQNIDNEDDLKKVKEKCIEPIHAEFKAAILSASGAKKSDDF